MEGEPRDFENVFEQIRKEVDSKAFRRAARVVGIVFLLAVLLTFLSASVNPFTEYLWFLHDAKHPEVFNLAYETRGSLFAVAFFGSWLLLYFNLRQAFSVTMIFLASPSSRGRLIVTNAITFLQSRGKIIVQIGAPIVAGLSALNFANEWTTYLLATHSQSFGKKDPTFGLDLSFFVFRLPWLRAMLNYAGGELLLTGLATLAIYAGLQSMAAIAKIELGLPKVRVHLHSLIGATMLVYAAQLYLKTYEVGLTQGAQFTGAGVAAMQGMVAERIIAAVLALTGIGTLINAKYGEAYVVPIRGSTVTFVGYVLGVLVYPSMLQRLYVDPDRLEREAPYATKAIDMTRFAYGLDRVEIKDEAPTPGPTGTDVADSRSTLENMRLWDTNVLQDCMEGLQGIRPYYQFVDVEVDRYKIDGKQTLLMLAPRQINLAGLQQSARNWTNERLRYTHGYGMVVAQVNQATPDGEPAFLAQDVPQKTSAQLAIDEPRIYFGSGQKPGTTSEEYALVDTAQAEFDYPTSDVGATHRWQGTGGIPVGGLLARLAFSFVLGDGNLLVSPEIKASSRLLIHRNLFERATRIFPFLHFDTDPYIVILNGKLVWVMDGYTTSDMVPYSELVGDGSLNYIRNSVKVTVDAYSGEVKAYAVAENEPILNAWRSIYPGLVQPSTAIPAELAAHFRYPEDMLNLQSRQFCTYHVTDPTVFLSNSDAWNVAAERGVEGGKESIRPFYVQMKLPGAVDPEFVQILPFTPNGRINMSGWLAAHCDPGQYGKLTLFKLNQATPIPGPEQMEGKFSATPEVSNINKQFQNNQSTIKVGNLLVVPIGNTFLYAESLFLKSNTQDLQAVPRLVKVILALKNRVVVKDTYQEALTAILGSETGQTAETSRPTQPTAGGSVLPAIQRVRQAADLLDQADAALRSGDFSKYGALQKQAREALRSLLSSSK